jgi:aspartate/methionine/tyrosine aminotransferase
MQTTKLLVDQLFDEVTPINLKEVQLLKKYIIEGSKHGDVIFLSMGESWSRPDEYLLKHLVAAPDYSHGYQLSQYGLPAFRQKAKEYLLRSNQITSEIHSSVEVAAVWSGTKNRMYTYGKYLADHYFEKSEKIAIVYKPSWEYGEVLSSLGYTIKYFELGKDLLPNPLDFQKYIESKKIKKALLVINAQHNPTGVMWPTNIVGDMVSISEKKNIALLIDDTYYGIVLPGVIPTSTLSCTVSKPRYAQGLLPWLLVRSLGKESNTNGWGIGVQAAHPTILEQLIQNYVPIHGYNTAGLFQYSFSQWLLTKEHSEFLDMQNKKIAHNRGIIENALVNRFGYSYDDFIVGQCSPYFLFKIPLPYQELGEEGATFFLNDFINHGIIMSSIRQRATHTVGEVNDLDKFIRVYIAPGEGKILDLVDRLEAIGFTYSKRIN